MVASPPHVEGHQWFAIVNPVAGNGRGLDDFPRISKLLREQQIHCEAVFSEHKFHAVELTVEAVRRGYRRIIAIGEEHSFLQDVGVVSYEEAKYRQNRYVANVAGAGYDAQVVRRFTHLKKKGRHGRWLYTWSVIRSFFRYKPTGVKVWVDGKRVYNNLLLSIALGVGKYNGGGVQQLPDAVADDGMFDISLVRPIHFWHIIFRFHKLFNGKIYEIRHILRERGSTIRIESSPEIELEVDGELLGHTPLEFTMLRRAVRVVVSQEFLASKAE